MTHDHDVEDRGATGQRTPLLGSSSHQRRGDSSKDEGWDVSHILQFFGGGIYAPDPSTYDPIEILLNTESGEEQDDLTKIWRDNKLSELNFVGVVVRMKNILPRFYRTPVFIMVLLLNSKLTCIVCIAGWGSHVNWKLAQHLT